MGKILNLILGVILLVGMMTSTCFAAISESQLALGGITPGSSPDYVRSVYGAPTKERKLRGLYDMSYTYGTSFVIFFDKVQSGEYVVVAMRSTANNGIKTPDGITVGMTRADVRRAYGQVDPNPYQGNKRDDSRFGMYNVYGEHGYGFISDYDTNGKIKSILAGSHE